MWCMKGVGGTWKERAQGSVSSHRHSNCQLFLSFLSQWFTEALPAVLPVNGAWLKTWRSQQSKEPVSTRSCAREQMNSFSCPPHTLPAPQTLALLGYHSHVPGCRVKSRKNPVPLVLRSDLLDSSRREFGDHESPRQMPKSPDLRTGNESIHRMPGVQICHSLHGSHSSHESSENLGSAPRLLSQLCPLGLSVTQVPSGFSLHVLCPGNVLSH